MFDYKFFEVILDMDNTLFKLYDLAVDNDISLFEFDCIDKAMIIKCDDHFAIALDMLSIKSEITEKEALAHELGHFFTNALYDFTTPLINITKNELRAEKWAIKALVSKREYLAAKNCSRNIFELAEDLNLSIETVIKADQIYCSIN